MYVAKMCTCGKNTHSCCTKIGTYTNSQYNTHSHPNWVNPPSILLREGRRHGFCWNGGSKHQKKLPHWEQIYQRWIWSSWMKEERRQGGKERKKEGRKDKLIWVAVCHKKVTWYKHKESKWWEGRGQGRERRENDERREGRKSLWRGQWFH